MNKKRLFKSLVLLFSSSLALGTFLSLRLAHKKDNINVVLAEGTPLPSSGGELASGTYYLEGDTNLTNYITVATGNNVIINLNGFTLKARTKTGDEDDQPVVYVNGGTLTINGKDNVTGNRGTLTNGTGYRVGGYTRGGAVAVYGGEAIINDCNLTGNRCCFGGAVFVINDNTATLNNCIIYDNDTYGGYGILGAVYAEDVGATVNINGGEIHHNDAGVYLWGSDTKGSKGNLNGVYVHDNVNYGVRADGYDNGNPVLTIAGDTIIENNATSSTTPVNLRINNTNNAKCAIVSELGDNASIGVTLTGDKTGGNTVFTSSADTSLNDVSKFFSDDANYAIAKNSDGQLYLTDGVATVTSGETVTKYLNFNDAVSAWNSAASGATLTLLKDATISSTINVSTTKTLDLNGCGINASGISSSTDYAILVNNGGYLTLNDSGNTTHYFTHERYKGYDAGLATICDQATYDAASEDSRGTFEGGYLTGLSIVKGDVSQSGFFKIEENSSVTMNGGTIIGIYADYSSSCVCSNGTFIINDGNMIYNVNARGCINARSGILTINGGNISHNTDKSSKNTGRTGALWLNNLNNPTYTIRGGTITNNVAVYGAINTQSDIAIEGNPVIKDNIGVGTDEESDAPMNIGLSWGVESKLNFIGEYTGSEPLGVNIYMDGVVDVTNSADVSFNNRNNVVSDNPNYAIGMYPSNHAKAGQLFIKGVETINVIDQIDNIDPLSYDGGKDDSLDDIVTAIDGYNNLPQDEQDFVDEINKDVLDHDIVTYSHVDKAGDLIKAIPEASDSQEYYDAVDAALAAYDALTDEEEAILNAAIDFQYKKTLDDNIAVKEVIELIQDIGEVTYKGGQDDSKDDIDDALDAYNNLPDELKVIVDNANKDDLDDAKETYDNVDEAVNLINSIGDINHGGENDSKEAIDAARETYDNLSDEEKALVKAFNNSTQTLEDAEEVYDVLVKIDDIGESDDEEKIKAARDAYDALTPEQKDQVGDKYVQKLITAENHSKDANILFIVFLILFILLIISGLIVMYNLLKRRKNENNDNNKQVKLASVSGLLPLVVLASYFTSSKFILVYVLGAVAILIWLTNLILFVSKKKQKEVKLEVKPETALLTTPQAIQNELVTEGEEVAPEIIPEDAKEEVISKVQDKEVIKHHESISVSKADEEMSDEKAESSIEEVEVIKPRKGKKEIINIDTLSENYNNGDEVTLESLIKKGLVPATTGRIKVLARGVLDKKLDVIADDFSIPAIKMIVLVGGHVKKIK